MERDQRIARLQSPDLYKEWNYEEIHLVENPDMGLLGIEPYELEAQFHEIPDVVSIETVKIMLAPILGDWQMKKTLIINKNNPSLFYFYQFGDLIIISEKAKSTFDKNDDMLHQYEAIDLIDKKGNSITDIRYHLMSVRRFVELSGNYPEMPNDKLISQMSTLERKMRSALINNNEIRNELVNLPIWKLPIERETVFMSLKMLQALRTAGCTGLNDYIVENCHKGSPVSYV
jgi:hypothetical protein